MAAFPLPIYLIALFLLFSHFKTLAAYPSSHFSFQGNFKGPNFDSNIALSGDAKVSENGSSVEFTQGLVIYKNSIRLTEGKSSPRSLASFSTYFSFSMSFDKGDGLAFFMVPNGFDVDSFGDSSFGFSLESEKSKYRIVAVEFGRMRDGNHVVIGIDGFVSAKSGNVSIGNDELSNGKRMHCWIDYEASYKRLEVRLSNSGDRKPVDPLLSDLIDLSEIWGDEALLVGLSSSGGNSSRGCFLYSWSFKLRVFPQWIHSEPVDPKAVVKDAKPGVIGEKRNCVLRALAAMVFGMACGALGASMAWYLWTILGNRRPVAPLSPEECVDFEYKKVKVVVDKAVDEECKV